MAELKSREAELLGGAGSCRFEEVDLVDVELVVHPIYEVGTDGFLEVGEGLQVRYLPEPKHVVVEELQPAGRPAIPFADRDPDGPGVYPREVNRGQVARDGRRHCEGGLHTGEVSPVQRVFQVVLADVIASDFLQLQCVEGGRLSLQFHSDVLLGVVFACSPAC